MIDAESGRNTGMNEPDRENLKLEFINRYGGMPEVIDVTLGNRSGEDEVAVTVATETERDAVEPFLPGMFRGFRVYVSLLFRLDSLAGDSRLTKEVESKMYRYPYNTWGTPEYEKPQELMREVFDQGQAAWAAMDDQARREAIEKEVENRRAQGFSDSGNCWAK